MKTSDYLFEFLASKGVDRVFMVAGGAAAHLIDSLRRSGIPYTCCYHEQACAMAAEGYAKIAQRPACVLVSNGPGSSNAITGVLGAYQDSVPMFIVSGQVKVKQSLSCAPFGLRQFGVQECDIVSMVRPITKHAVQITDPGTFQCHVEMAYHCATIGRAGPVWLDIPIDIQSADITVAKHFNFVSLKCDEYDVAEVIELLNNARRPVIITGNGIHLSNTEEHFRKLKDMLGIPIVSTWTSKDLMAFDDNLFVGAFGILGERAANFAVQNADLLLVLGSRLSVPNIGYNTELFSPNSVKVVVDIDNAELDKNTVKIDYKVHDDLKCFLLNMLAALEGAGIPSRAGWVALTQSWKREYPVLSDTYENSNDGVNAFHFMKVLSANLKDDDIVVTDMGTSYTCTMQALRTNGKNRLFTSSGCCSMGFGLPGAIGAWYAAKRGRIILIAGDGGFQMNIQELQTVAQNGIPIKIFILNSDGYLAVSLMQDNLFNGARMGSDPASGVSAPDFVGIAEAYGLNWYTIYNTNDISYGIAKALECEDAVLCEVKLIKNQLLIPRVQSHKNADGSIESDALDNMFPYITASEMENVKQSVNDIYGDAR